MGSGESQAQNLKEAKEVAVVACLYLLLLLLQLQSTSQCASQRLMQLLAEHRKNERERDRGKAAKNN